MELLADFSCKKNDNVFFHLSQIIFLFWSDFIYEVLSNVILLLFTNLLVIGYHLDFDFFPHHKK